MHRLTANVANPARTGASARRALLGWGSVAAVFVAAVIAGCASLNQAPDPAKIQREFAESRSEELELVRTTIADPERSERFVALLSRRDRLIERYAEDIAAHRHRIAALSTDYDTERGEFESLLAEFNRKRSDAQTELIDLVWEMKQATIADEWRTISKFQSKRLNPRDLAYAPASGGT